jgi:hypothetical protein
MRPTGSVCRCSSPTGAHEGTRPSQRTFAVTDDVPVTVKVHDRRRFPSLEHAPDQTASRPFETVSLIDVPMANDADRVLPTLTLMPVGLDVTRSPLLPVAVTVKVAVPDGGGGGDDEDVTVSVPLRLTPP